MATSGISSFATLLKIGDGGGPETFTTIAEVTDIGGPNLSTRTKEATSHSSTSGWAEYIPTILEGGDVTFKLNFIPTAATHSQTSGVLKDMKNRTKRNFQLVFSDTGATTWSFAAFVTKFSPKEPVDGILSADVSLKITGVCTLAG